MEKVLARQIARDPETGSMLFRVSDEFANMYARWSPPFCFRFSKKGDGTFDLLFTDCVAADPVAEVT